MKLKKVIIAPDSFKGSLTAEAVADIIAAEVESAFPECKIIKLPFADGGEGSLQTIMTAVGGEIFEAEVKSPDGNTITARYGMTKGQTAVLELAQSSGITRQKGLHPLSSSTFGFGQLIAAALDRGALDFVLCLGGSATTDGGCGMASALGAKFFDREGREFVPCGATLKDIEKISLSQIDGRIHNSSFTAMCDVDNSLYGPRGAAFVYAPQKGASGEEVELLDSGLRNLANRFAEIGFADCQNMSGAGAAGGLGAGCVCFLGAKLRTGSDAILELCDFKGHLQGADLIITGEGRLDSQSFSGKAISGVLKLAGGLPVIAVCGDVGCTKEECQKNGLTAFSASEGVGTRKSMQNPERYLAHAARNAVKYIVEI